MRISSLVFALYDLHTDRSETKNLAADMPEKIRDLAARWSRQTEECSALARKDAPPAKNTDGK